MDVAQQLRASGRVSRGRLGVTIQELTPELARSFRIPDAAGVLVTGFQHAQLTIDGETIDDRRGFVDWFVDVNGEWKVQAAVDLPAPRF